MLRVLRLNRFVRDEQAFARVRAAFDTTAPITEGAAATGAKRTVNAFELQLARVVTSISSLLVVTAGFLYTTESDQVPDFFTALFFGLTTLTTVGTFTPHTPAGRFVVSIAVLVGVAVLPLQLSRLAEAYGKREDGTEPSAATEARDDDSTPAAGWMRCGECGASDHRADAAFCYMCGGVLAARLPPPSETEAGRQVSGY